jgi:uncharacterized cupredoxin-like copper-binding protein
MLLQPLRLVVLALALALLPACSAGSNDRAARGTVVRVIERDFRIKVSPAKVRAGDVRLLIRNKGPVTHELYIARSQPEGLPMRSDALTVDEEAIEDEVVGEEEAEEPGSTHELLLHLKPGRYELFCNMAGHYLGGMQARLVVN